MKSGISESKLTLYDFMESFYLVFLQPFSLAACVRVYGVCYYYFSADHQAEMLCDV